MIVFTNFDHAAAAGEVGLRLRPTTVLAFGNPRAGTLLMQASTTVAIDLPLKALVWRDDREQVFLSYLSPAWLAARHGLAPSDHAIVQAMESALADISREATGRVSGSA